MNKTVDKHSGDPKRQAGQAPTRNRQRGTHFRTTSAATVMNSELSSTLPVRRSITLTGSRDGASTHEHRQAAKLERLFERNQALVAAYLGLLEERGQRLPENPAGGEVFFPQVEVESGLNANSLAPKRGEAADPYIVRLRELIVDAAPRLGLELRILPRLPCLPDSAITYSILLGRGTAERRRELQGKLNCRQQLYNTRSALCQFVKRSTLEDASPVGDELAAGFEGAVGRVAATYNSHGTLKKFMTGIQWWHDFYQRLLKEQSLPAEFRRAMVYLVEGSGLPPPLVAKLVHVSATTLKAWCQGSVPAVASYGAVERIEKLFKLPAGTLIGKLTSRSLSGRFSRSQLPEFLQNDPRLTSRVGPHLPDDFCELESAKQAEIVESICTDILRGNDPYTLNMVQLLKLPYRLKEWPQSLANEFEDLAAFKTGERPPLGMRRNGVWRLTTARKMRKDLSLLFGALCLPADAEDVRVRGLGVPGDHLTFALLACPLLLDWFIRFGAARQGRYTGYAITLLEYINSMLRPGTGWLRQRPDLASRLRPVSGGSTELVSRELIERARTDWEGVCDAAHRYNKNLIKELKPLIRVARDPFLRIEGVLEMNSPMEGLKVLLDGMRHCLPNKDTRPSQYHTAIRNCALVALLAVTGLRCRTLSLLNYDGTAAGHLSRQNGRHVLKIPRSLFKEESGPFFGPAHARKDYVMRLPDALGLTKLLDEYLNVSRPWLMNRFHPGSKEFPLFVTSANRKSVRVVPIVIHMIYRDAAVKHLVENKWRGTGIPGVKPHGPHSVRHIRGTEMVKRTGSFQMAADANHNSERMARIHYARFLPADRNERVNEVLFDGKEVKD